MYNAMLTKVVALINQTEKATKPATNDERSDFYNMLFSQELYNEQKRKEQKREDIKNKAIVAVTSLAVAGEAYHLIKRSGIITKIKNR